MPPAPERLTAALDGRYRLERELGAGGMATVYLARDLRHDRDVALKVLRPELAAVIGAERFLAEIRTTANLQHPHILPLHDSGEVAGNVFYVMPFIAGESLRAKLERERQLPIGDAVQIVLDVASALDYAHRHGVIHRDIKPENILLHDGRAVVADFGIALAATTAGSRMTETGMSLGTPTYMSPEQAMGERTLDGRTDVYALGCVLYELLVGAPPFVGPTAQAIVAKVLTERPAPPSSARDTVSPALDAVLLTALAKLPADRQPTAAAFADELREAMRAPIGPQGAERSSSGAGPGPTPTAGLGSWRGIALGAALGATLVAGISWLRDARRPIETSERRIQLTFDGIARRPAISADGKFVAYVVTACPGGPEVPCSATLQVQEMGGSRPITLVEDAEEIGRPRWTRDGSQLVYSARLDAEREGVYAIPRLGGDPRLVTGRAGTIDLHPRADSLVILQDGWAVVLDLERGMAQDSIAVPSGGGRGIAWSPDGRRFAMTHNYTQLRVIARDGSASDTLSLTARPDVVWSRDGKSVLLFVAREGTVDDLVHVPVDGKGRLAREPLVLLAKEGTALYGELDLAREAGRMVILSGSILIDFWRFRIDRPGEPERLTQGTAWFGAPSLGPDGTQLYYARSDAIGDNLFVLDADGRQRALTREPYPGSTEYRIATDGRRVLFSHALPAGSRLSEMRLPSGDVRHTPFRRGALFDPVPVGATRIAWLNGSADSLLFTDSLGAPERAVPLGAGRSGSIARGGRSEREVTVYATRSVDGTRRHEILQVPLDGSAVRVVATVPGPVLGLEIRAEERIWFARWVAGEAAMSWWELPAGGGPAIRRVSVPNICTSGRLTLASAAPVGVCSAAVRRADVWVVDGVWQ